MINDFRGQYGFLSNFWYSDQYVDGVRYVTNEHYFQSQKTLNLDHRELIKVAVSPGVAKRMCSSKGHKGFKIVLREDWDDIKLDVMQKGIQSKFLNSYLRKLLMDTGNLKLVEDNIWHDNFWGNCICYRCRAVPGLNWLGQILMIHRGEIIMGGD